ncbi:MAG TPA: rubredoxin [Firmicutes bacterium]|nr:rubredoxin [Bacillota bacterium]
MATWRCSSCGYEKDSRCKPQKCPQCGTKGSFTKKE